MWTAARATARRRCSSRRRRATRGWRRRCSTPTRTPTCPTPRPPSRRSTPCAAHHRLRSRAIGHVPSLRRGARCNCWVLAVQAAHTGHREVVRVLLAAGADTTAENRRKKTALQLAKSRKHTEIVRATWRQRYPSSPLLPPLLLPVLLLLPLPLLQAILLLHLRGSAAAACTVSLLRVLLPGAGSYAAGRQRGARRRPSRRGTGPDAHHRRRRRRCQRCPPGSARPAGCGTQGEPRQAEAAGRWRRKTEADAETGGRQNVRDPRLARACVWCFAVRADRAGLPAERGGAAACSAPKPPSEAAAAPEPELAEPEEEEESVKEAMDKLLDLSNPDWRRPAPVTTAPLLPRCLSVLSRLSCACASACACLRERPSSVPRRCLARYLR